MPDRGLECFQLNNGYVTPTVLERYIEKFLPNRGKVQATKAIFVMKERHKCRIVAEREGRRVVGYRLISNHTKVCFDEEQVPIVTVSIPTQSDQTPMISETLVIKTDPCEIKTNNVIYTNIIEKKAKTATFGELGAYATDSDFDFLDDSELPRHVQDQD